MLVKDAKAIANVTTGNTKMPGTTFAQDAFACHVGSKLAKIEGSICNKCYARRIQKLRPSVNQGYTRNLANWRNYNDAGKADTWVTACVFQIKRQTAKLGQSFHRWFDSGDLDSIEQLIAICDVAKDTPEIKHWLPTREVAIVTEYLQWFGSFPENLCVRVSAPMVDGVSLKGFPNVSGVFHKSYPSNTHVCPAPTQGNNCGDCRACWDVSVKSVHYRKH